LSIWSETKNGVRGDFNIFVPVFVRQRLTYRRRRRFTRAHVCNVPWHFQQIKIWFQNRRARDRRDNSTVGRPSYNRDSSTIVQLTQLPVSSTSAFRPPSTTRAHTATNNVRNRRDETAIHWIPFGFREVSLYANSTFIGLYHNSHATWFV